MKRIYRVVIDQWPTPDGLPFDEQRYVDWDDLDTESHSTWPEWLPHTAPMNEFLRGGGRERDGAPIDEWVAVPSFTNRTWLARSGAVRRVERLAKFGVVAHVERSKPVEWEATP